jgi:Fe-S-cluster containining protein
VERYIGAQGIAPVAQESVLGCPFLQADKTCGIYPMRPLICRVFGHAEDAECPRGRNVNVPQREIKRMLVANGKPTRCLHEFVPGLRADVERFVASELLKSEMAR